MSSNRLTPYDTGARLEPQPWPLTSDDHYGLVDFDDDESATVFTAVGKAFDDGTEGYLLSVTSNAATPVIEVDGDRAVPITEELLDGLQELADLADRGWEDFEHQAKTTPDYTPEDVADAIRRWKLAQSALNTIRRAACDHEVVTVLQHPGTDAPDAVICLRCGAPTTIDLDTEETS